MRLRWLLVLRCAFALPLGDEQPAALVQAPAPQEAAPSVPVAQVATEGIAGVPSPTDAPMSVGCADNASLNCSWRRSERARHTER